MMSALDLPTPPDVARYYKRHREAERDFMRHAQEETGLTAENWERQVADRMQIKAQSDAIAERMEYAGKLAWRQTVYGLGKWWIHSRKLEMIPQYRRVCILPYVAAVVRAGKLAALEYFMQRNRHCRFWTFTSGVRCGLDDLRKRCRYLHRKLSKLSAFLREKYGVEIIFRSTEFGTVEWDENGNAVAGGSIEFDARGEPLFHVHAHVVMHSLVGRIPPERWSRMISDVWEFWSHNWQADGVIRDARECCKYVTKPGDILKLSPEQLGRFHEQVYRAKLCQPMGALAQEIRERKAAKKMLRRYRKKDGTGCIWKEAFSQNEQCPISPEERALADNLADAERFAEEHRLASRVDVESPAEATETVQAWAFKNESGEFDVHRERVTVGGFWAGTEYRQPTTEKDFSRVLARLSPSIGPSGRKEPAVVVSFSRFDQSRTESHPLVSRLWAETVDQWEAGLGADHAPISVHTGTPTVRKDRGSARSKPEHGEAVDPSPPDPCPFEGV